MRLIFGSEAGYTMKNKLICASLGLLSICSIYLIHFKFPVLYEASNRKDVQDKLLWTQFTKANTEVRHIAFLKIHKAASTTAQNIFLRFGAVRNLLFVFPKVPKFMYPNVISYTGTLSSNNILSPPNNRRYEILCCHVLYDRSVFETVMPSDTKYIGIVRDPFDHFISSLNYFRPKEVLDIQNPYPVSEFLRHPTKYMSNSSQSFVNNRMALEYGFPSKLFQIRNIEQINSYITKLDKEFHLMIIVERFDESVVLMRRILNWKMKDVLYVKKNARSKLHSSIKFIGKDVQLYKRWAELDYALYDFFFKRLADRISQAGSNFNEELLYFKRLRTDVEYYCKQPGGSPNLTIKASEWGEAFDVTKADCKMMFAGEIEFIRKIRLQQYGFFNETFN